MSCYEGGYLKRMCSDGRTDYKCPGCQRTYCSYHAPENDGGSIGGHSNCHLGKCSSTTINVGQCRGINKKCGHCKDFYCEYHYKAVAHGAVPTGGHLCEKVTVGGGLANSVGEIVASPVNLACGIATGDINKIQKSLNKLKEGAVIVATGGAAAQALVIEGAIDEAIRTITEILGEKTGAKIKSLRELVKKFKSLKSSVQDIKGGNVTKLKTVVTSIQGSIEEMNHLLND